jgi:hypothetical protein
MPFVQRHSIVAFQTWQRLSVMLVKTSLGYEGGCLLGSSGPCRCRLPAPGKYLRDTGGCLQVYRVNERTVILADIFISQHPKTMWMRFIKHAHGVLLRRIGRVRVVYAVLDSEDNSQIPCFHSNINMVTGVPKTWLDTFEEGNPIGECIMGLRG